jgi:hypothetical protein
MILTGDTEQAILSFFSRIFPSDAAGICLFRKSPAWHFALIGGHETLSGKRRGLKQAVYAQATPLD